MWLPCLPGHLGSCSSTGEVANCRCHTVLRGPFSPSPRVIEWLRGYQTESESREGSEEESEEDSQPDHPTNTKERLGAIIQRGDPTDSQNGSTASQGGPSWKGSIASQGGPVHNGSTASRSQGGSRKRSLVVPEGEEPSTSTSAKRRKSSGAEDTQALTPFDPGVKGWHIQGTPVHAAISG